MEEKITSSETGGNKKIPVNRNIRPGDFIVATKWIGIKGSLKILDLKRDDLIKRFGSGFLEYFDNYEDCLSTEIECHCSDTFNVRDIKKVSERGIFGALWDLSQIAGRGLEVYLKKIPVRQEVIEIFNFLDLSPYEADSTGMVLFVCEDTEGLIEYLNQNGINASVIGKIRDDNDKIIINGEDIRYIDKIKHDSLEIIN